MKEENSSNSNAVQDLQNLAQIGLALSHEHQLGSLLEMIVNAARSMTNADAGTLYILDSELRSLRFCIMQNETTRTKINAVDNPDAPIPEPVPLYVNGAPNNANVSSYVALTGEPVKISDVYSAQGFNFSGVKHYDTVSGYRSQSMLVIPMRDHNDDIIGILQLLNSKSAGTGKVTDFSERHEVLVSSLASQAAVSITNRRLLSGMEKDLEEIRRLRQAEEELGDKLRKAYLKTEETNAELKAAMAQTSAVRKIWMFFVLCLILAGATWQAFAAGNLGTILATTEDTREYAVDNGSIATIKVANSPVSANLSFVGQIEPLSQKVYLSPFSGKVIEKHYIEGQLIKAGEPLLELDTSEIGIKVRQARSNLIRAQKDHTQIKEWAGGPRVSQARLNQARQNAILDSLKRKLDEAVILFDKGIIPKVELESSQEAFENQKINAQAAEDEVKSLLALGSRDQLLIASMELQNAQAELDELEAQLAKATITAEEDGIILLPASEEQRQQELKSIEVGTKVQQGETLVVIGDLSGLTIRTKVDEVSISKLSLNQLVQVTSDAFPGIILDGWISAIACQALGSASGRSSGGKPPVFDVTVTVDELSPEQQSKIRMGMSAILNVTVYDNPAALVVPISAVESGYGYAQVYRKNPQTLTFEKVPITAGITTLEQVEILSGLALDDEVALFPDEVMK
ncbi:MAG: hypothetical protein GQF41_4179 [Candidatus Rifleibacterium amylolyticum]|nr:MAG: hypothetical protein GQF41_4179 [Candidatus Rifleibacterium amylolyticum]